MYENCKGIKGEVENGPGGKKEIECTKFEITRERVSAKKKKITPHRHPKASPDCDEAD